MFKIRWFFIGITFLLLVACSSVDSDRSDATGTGPPPVSTVAPTPVAAPSASTDANPTATTVAPTPEPEADELTVFVIELELALVNQDNDNLRRLMNDPMAVAGWRSEGRSLNPAQVMGQFQSGALPAPVSVRFSDLSMTEIGDLLGQPPASLFGPTANIVAARHSTGWGQAMGDEAIVFVAEADGRYTWYGFLYTTGRFADANLSTVGAPVGLMYTVADMGLYQIQLDGFHRQLLDGPTAATPNLKISPDGRFAAYVDDERQLWLIDTLTGKGQQVGPDYDFSGSVTWGDGDNILVGIWLTPDEAEGPNNGHLAILNAETRELQILDENRLSFNRPALSPDGRTAAFSVFPASGDDAIVSRIFQPNSGVTVFDPGAFTFTGDLRGESYFNPAWSPDGSRIAWITAVGERFALHLFDLEEKTAVQLHDWDPARFGATVPSPVWSPGGQYLALEVWANGNEGSGIWLLPVDGREKLLIDAQGRDPFWVNDDQFVFGVNGDPRLFELVTGQIAKLDLDAGTWILGVTSMPQLVSLPDHFGVALSTVTYLTISQDVTMYSGPNATFAEVGMIADGQTALVTGMSAATGWWRVICPDDTVGNCFITGDPALVTPTD